MAMIWILVRKGQDADSTQRSGLPRLYHDCIEGGDGDWSDLIAMR